MKKAKFAMAFHCYQPVFNFDSEFENAYQKAYLPLLTVLKKYPEIKASFHFSGNILEWIISKYPEYIFTLKELLQKGQIELIGGGYFEPIMPIIPENDRFNQIKLHDDLVSEIFDTKTKGFWLAERVWEPELINTLANANKKYTIIDDYHMFQAGEKIDDIFKPYILKRDDKSLMLFPSLTTLRYSMPFRSPSFILDYFRGIKDKNNKESTCFFFADDAEKFGAWPYTYKHVYKNRWLETFFELLLDNSSWIETFKYSEIMDSVVPSTIDEVPASSYYEMMKWSGGDFKNFIKKYPEVTRMHSRMISISKRAELLSKQYKCDNINLANKELFKAQSNCAYWHGTFGGVYLPHLREGVYKHLLKAECILDKLSGTEKNKDSVRAIECNSLGDNKEVVISNKDLNIFISTNCGGVVSELDYIPLKTNLVNTVSRTKEKYHKKLDKRYMKKIRDARIAVMRGKFADIHDVLGIAEKGLRKVLCYDNYIRTSFLTHIFTKDIKWKDLKGSLPSSDVFLNGVYKHKIEPDNNFLAVKMLKRDRLYDKNNIMADIEVKKNITLGTLSSMKYLHKIINHSETCISFRYAVEYNFLIWDRSVISRPKILRTDKFSLKDRYSGTVLDFFMDKVFTISLNPLYTVNETESGLRKTFQGISILIGDDFEPDKKCGKNEMSVSVTIG